MKDIYVVFKGGDIQGETTDAEHAKDKAIEVSSWKHFIAQPKSSTSSTAGGHSAERTEHGEMVFTKDIDTASAKLWQACSAGSVYNEVIIYFYRAYGGKNRTENDATKNSRANYLKIELKDVVVSSVSTNISPDAELPTETFGLKYSGVKWTYSTAPVDGTAPKVAGTGSWNLKTNTVKV
jgi:type VI secretion system secreted protein Hcp